MLPAWPWIDWYPATQGLSTSSSLGPNAEPSAKYCCEWPCGTLSTNWGVPSLQKKIPCGFWIKVQEDRTSPHDIYLYLGHFHQCWGASAGPHTYKAVMWATSSIPFRTFAWLIDGWESHTQVLGGWWAMACWEYKPRAYRACVCDPVLDSYPQPSIDVGFFFFMYF